MDKAPDRYEIIEVIASLRALAAGEPPRVVATAITPGLARVICDAINAAAALHDRRYFVRRPDGKLDRNG